MSPLYIIQYMCRPHNNKNLTFFQVFLCKFAKLSIFVNEQFEFEERCSLLLLHTFFTSII